MACNRATVVCLLIATISSNKIYGAHQPVPGAPAFVRSSVESIPLRTDPKSEAYISVAYGETALPLRTAVESIPSVQASQKSFIRESVEFRPKNDDSLLRYEEEGSQAAASSNLNPFTMNYHASGSAYGAYVIPKAYDPLNPQPFRSDSPYQQLIDTKVVHNDLLSRFRGSLKDSKNTDGKKVLCFITNWSFYRSKDGKFVPEMLDSKLCTHIIYSFGSLDPSTLTVKEFDKWADIDNDLYRRTTSISKNVPVLLAIGGWTDSTGDKYSKLVSSAAARRNFVRQMVPYLQQFGFQGVHFDWNYPRCWQSDCRKGPESDKPNFTRLIKEIAAEFSKHDLILGVGISGYKEIIIKSYEIEELSKAADFLMVSTYDYHGAWEKRTGHVSPLYGKPDDKYPQYNTDYTIQLLKREGADPKKILLGVPFYGQSFTLADKSMRLVGEGIATRGPGKPGEYTKQPGMLAYYEICDRIKNKGWRKGREASQKSGPFAMLDDQWVGYEDYDSVAMKAKYVLDSGLGGIAAWTVDLDDFSNRCCSESFPLLKSINRVFNRVSSPKPASGSNCQRPPAAVTPAAPITTTVGPDGIPGPAGTAGEQTTWPGWHPSGSSSTTASSEFTWWPTTTHPTTPATSTKAPTTITTTESAISENGEIIPVPVNTMPVSGGPCAAVDGTYKRHPYSCSKYYQCVYGEYIEYSCAGGLHWREHGNFCDWPASAKCEERVPSSSEVITKKPTTTTALYDESIEYITSTTEKRTTQKPATVTTSTVKPYSKPASTTPTEPCENGKYAANVDDCENYFICVNHKWIRQDCGYGFQFDQTALECDLATKVRCVPASRYLKFIGKSISKVQLDDPCDGRDYVPYPGNCQDYLLCLHGTMQAGSCGNGLHWNAQSNICDWPANANCKEEGNPMLIENGGGNGGSSNEVAGGYIPVTTTTTTTKKPKPVEPRPPVKPFSSDYKLVCYFTNWAWYRQGAGKYLPEDIDGSLCTHIVYGFATLDYTELTIRVYDSWADVDNRFYERVVAYQKKGANVSLALGGWNDSQGDKYSRLVRSPPARKRFVEHAVQFLEKYGFNGLDLDWEYPVCWQTECNRGFSDEKQGFSDLVRELSIAFKPRNLLLSTAVSPSKQIIDKGYDVPEISKYFDWIAVMTYDFHGQWDKKTGHVAPLYYHPDDEFDYFNANYSLHYWIEKGAPATKIIMGVPLYGQSFTLSDPKNNGLNAKAPAGGQAGEYTRSAGFLAYYEICDRINNKGWTVVQDPKRRMGPYAYKDNQWVSFDDKAMVRQKAKLIRQLGLGGGMIWALDLDDFRGQCGEGAHPLLTELQSVLAPSASESDRPDPPTNDNSNNNSNNENSDVEIIEETPQHEDTNDANIPAEENHQSTSAELISAPQDSDYKVVCYFTNWAWYRQGGGKFLPEDIDAKLCTHIVYGFAVLDGSTLTIKSHDSWADLDNNFYERVTAYRKKGVKVTVAIGGWNDSAGDKYSKLVRNAASRARFIKKVVEFIEKWGFDGLDLDWEYPVCWQVECNKGYADEKEHFAEFVKELSKEFKPRGWLLSAAVSPSQQVIDAGYDVPTLSKYFDWIAVMAYDYHGQWDKQTGHVAPMYAHPLDVNPYFNTNFTINYWIEKGADSRKLVLGMPMYGQSFSLAENKRHGLNSPTYGGGEAGEATRARGFLSYYEICERIQKQGWSVVRDKKGRMGPYAYKKDQWVSFDDSLMIRHKCQFVKAMNLGGAMIWALDLDDFKNYCGCEEYPLLRTINRALRNYPGPHPKCQLEKIPEVEDDVPTSDNDVIVVETPEKPTTTRPTTTTTRKPQIPNESIPPSDDDDQHPVTCSEQFSPHPSDCNKYYLCDNGHPLLQSCPAGLHWNKQSNNCDWPLNAKCEESEQTFDSNRPTTSPKPTTTTTLKPRPKPPTNIIPTEHDDGSFKVVCYFTNWPFYRPGEGKYLPENIDENLCTHIVYGFSVLDGTTLTIKTHDSWADIDNSFYDRVTAYRKKGIKVTIAIGGWNDSLGDKYSRLVLSASARYRFITDVIEFIEKYNFDGLDLDWEYPVCWQVECDRGKPQEKQAFAEFVKELSEEFKPRGWLLSAAVSPSKMVIDAGYDIPKLAKYFDWIAVMTYDYHGQWDRQTGHVAPLYYYPGDRWDYFNANFTINYWINKGAPSRKIVMGVPCYGQSFVLSNAQNYGLNSPSYGPGDAGKYTRAGGFLSYYEICEKTNRDGWTVVRDPQNRIGPYAYKGNQWVSYDDVEIVRKKSQFMRDLNLGGGMIWALDLDDFTGSCGCGKYPLLTTINQVLRGTSGPKLDNCT